MWSAPLSENPGAATATKSDSARAKLYADMAAVVPVKRVGAAADVGAAVTMLAANSFMTGTIIDCDGGRHLGA